MGAGVIPYEPYHPHLWYTLVFVTLARLVIAGYSRKRLSHNPQQRVKLYALALLLPVLAEVGMWLVYHLRPAPESAIGAVLTRVHVYYIQSIPIDTYISPIVTALFVIGLLVLFGNSLIVLQRGIRQLGRAMASAQPIQETRFAALLTLIEPLERPGRRRPMIVVLESDATAAFVSGMTRPRIYVTSALLAQLSPTEALAVICHEWAHILRGDQILNWLLRPLRDVLFFVPGSFSMWRQLIVSQDEACDQLAAEMTGRPLDLARALVRVAEAYQRAPLPPAPLLSGLISDQSRDLEWRVKKMILQHQGVCSGRWTTLITLALGVALIVFAILPALLGS